MYYIFLFIFLTDALPANDANALRVNDQLLALCSLTVQRSLSILNIRNP